MGNINGNKRRGNLGFKYSVFDEVNFYSRSTDTGERVNIFLTELTRISSVVKLTLSERSQNVYFGADNLKALLTHNNFKTIINELIARDVIKRADIMNRYGIPVYSFEPVFYKPVIQGVPIRNLKVRNGVRKYLGIQVERISENVHKWIKSGLIKTEIIITENEFFADPEIKYRRYKENKQIRGERFRSPGGYMRDMELTYYAIRQFQQLSKPRRAGYVREDNFSGRVYNIATGVPRWLRSFIRIQGEPVAEIDMVSSHAFLLWNIVPKTDFITFIYGATARGSDFYDCYGQLIGVLNRREVKFRFLRSLYGRTSSKYYKEFKKHFPQAGAVLDMIKTTQNPRNPSNDKGTHTNLAFKLLNLEVSLFRRVWEALYVSGIPFLSIHDGIIVPVSQASRARVIMEQILIKSIPIIQTKTIYY